MLAIEPFAWAHWPDLWRLHVWQLAEHGVFLPATVAPPDPASPYEPDLHHIAKVYLTGAGNFWLAGWDHVPVGHIGAQDIGGAVELRRMYVRAEYRRRGIGAQLIRTLIAHSHNLGVSTIELSTAADGLGRPLYAAVGFQVVDEPGQLYRQSVAPYRYSPALNEIRMRLTLP